MCISVSLSGFVVLGCMFAPKVHIIMFQPQKNVTSHRLNLNRFSVSGAATTYASHGRLHGVINIIILFLKKRQYSLTYGCVYVFNHCLCSVKYVQARGGLVARSSQATHSHQGSVKGHCGSLGTFLGQWEAWDATPST